MNEQTPPEDQPDESSEAEARPLPFLKCHGEGYITRKDGTIVPFTIDGETQKWP